MYLQLDRKQFAHSWRFIDRGYLELAKGQCVHPTNLIQIMTKNGVKFLDTIKESKSFPFQVVDVNESDTHVLNKCPIIQAYGTRSYWVTRSGDIQASALRHGLGKIRCARIATNIIEVKGDDWVYDTTNLKM